MDFVGMENVDQESMFARTARNIAEKCVEGYNGTIFAYGQTGSGKTHTIQGPENDHGIMQRSFKLILDKLAAEK